MNITHFLENTLTLVSSKDMLRSYLTWRRASDDRPATIDVPGGQLSGFRSFSEFLGTKNGIPSPGVFQFLRRRTKSDSVVFDIGANFGVFSIILGALTKNGHVYSFEPVPQTYNRLMDNVKRNGLQNVNCMQCAVLDTPGSVTFAVNAESPATNRLMVGTIEVKESPLEVEATSIDEFCSSRKLSRLDFVKIDVEGAEAKVLLGATHMLESHRISTLLVEICPANLQRQGSRIEELEGCVQPYGYDFYRIGVHGEIGDRLTTADLTAIVLEDVALLPITSSVL